MKQFSTGNLRELHEENTLQVNISDISAGVQEVSLPSFNFSHILVINNTGHAITFSRDNTLTAHSIIGKCAKYSTISIPYPSMVNRCYIHRSGEALTGEIAFIYFTAFAPGISGNFGQVVTEGRRGQIIDRSGSISAANVSQIIAPANTSRNFFMFQNRSSVDMFLNFTNPATNSVGSFLISPMGSLTFDGGYCPTDIINIICSQINAIYTAKEG